MTIIAFNDGNFDSGTIKQVLSLGPTFVVMKLIESEILFFFSNNFQFMIFNFSLCNKQNGSKSEWNNVVRQNHVQGQYFSLSFDAIYRFCFHAIEMNVLPLDN